MAVNFLEQLVIGGSGLSALNASMLIGGYIPALSPSAENNSSVQDPLIVSATSDSTADTIAKRDIAGSCKFNKLTANHLSNASSLTPSVALGSGSGEGSQVSILGGDSAGQILLTIGEFPIQSAPIFTVTFSQPYINLPIVQVCPFNSTTAKLRGVNTPYVGSVTNYGFSFNSNDASIAPSQTYEWTYMVIESSGTITPQ